MKLRFSSPAVRRVALLALALPLLTPSLGWAQMYSAGDPCPELTPGRVFTQEGAAGPALVCNGTTLEVYESIKTGPMRKGVGTANPAAMLDVAGEAKIGNTSLACSATTEGAMRYNSTSKEMEYCNGTAWGSLAPAAGGGSCGDEILQGTYYSVGGARNYCQQVLVDSFGNKSFTPINDGTGCGDGMKCSSGACSATGNAPGSVMADGSIYVDGTIYVMPYDQSSSAYWGAYNYTTGATSTTNGPGNQTNVYAHVMAGDGSANPDDGYTPNAFVLCHNLTFGGHSDWYLPAQDELITILTNYTAIGGISSSSYYWSSSENGNGNAWMVSPGGGLNTNNKTAGYAVRCVRR